MSEADNLHRDRRIRRALSGRIKAAFTRTPAGVGALEADLKRAVTGEVRFDRGTRALYATDASNYRQLPIGVVIPRSIDDVVAAVKVARKHDAPLLPRGCGTSLAGQACNTAVVVEFSKHLRCVIELDPERRLARVEPGCVLDDLRQAAEEHKLTFGPDPATHSHNTLGGMIGNNSGGVHSVMAGLTVDNVHSLDVLTYDGTRMEVGPTSDADLQRIVRDGGRPAEIYRRLAEFRDTYADRIRAGFPDIPRRVSGYANLDWLLPEKGFHVARALVGTEATCVTVLGATLRLVPSPPERIGVVLGFPSIFEAADVVPQVLEHTPLAVEGIDSKLIDNMRAKGLHSGKLTMLPEGEGWLVVEFGGDTVEEATAQAEAFAAAFQDRAKPLLLRTRHEQSDIRLIRESGLGASAYVPGQPETWEGWEDCAVPRERLGDYLRDFRTLLDKYGYDTVMYGHFGDGLVHCRIDFDLGSEKGLAIWRRFLDEAADLVTRYGGSLSGEHGDGQSRAELLDKMYGPDLVRAFSEFRAIWDPRARMNPGKVIAPYPITSNLRVGPEHDPAEVKARFGYPDDDGSFARATMRCVGVGKCRRPDAEDGGVMCPSYMATREEMHSTRGRARLLFEMLRQDPLERGWRSETVEEALDLCLACKGCKSDCPVHVDMATYKAEFRARHYAGRLRPRAAYSMGLIYWWSRLGGRIPRTANLFARGAGLSKMSKWLGGVAQARTLPPFAPEPFTRAFRRTRKPSESGARVLLWPDTFNNFYTPHVLDAAAKVFERGGFTVAIPPRPLCCGRPLYDWGMLDAAERLLRQTLDALSPHVEAGVPLVGLEPACVTSFRDELPNLLPDHPLSKRLARQSYFFSEFVEANADRWSFNGNAGKALVQLHCHHHAVIKPDAEWHLLERLGVDIAANPPGCCGMAGGFGFEAGKYDVSRRVAELSLLPALRNVTEDTAILANGFSCREQIRQLTGREPRHVAELMSMDLKPQRN